MFFSTARLLATFILLTSTVYAATIAQVVDSNNALKTQSDTLDSSVVAIDGNTPTATRQQQPTKLQSLNLAIVSAKASLTPTATTSDPAQESLIKSSFGSFANAIQELAVDYYYAFPYLSTVPNLQRDVYNQINYLNTNFNNYATFVQGVVGEARFQTYVKNNAGFATDQIVRTSQRYA